MKLILAAAVVLVLFVFSFSSSQQSSGYGSGSSFPRSRPDIDQVPEYARWLIASAKWGVLATVDRLGDGGPFGYVVSFSDAGTGVPYFYLSILDPAGMNLKKDPRSSFTVSEAEFGSCTDPQSPTCGKITLIGDVVMLDTISEEAEVAEAALFADHPLFSGFPKMNRTFAVYKLEIRRIFLVNKSAPPRDLTVQDYLEVA